jgi:fluoride exporter
MLNQFLLIGLGGAIGAILRYGVAQWKYESHFPFHTFWVNVIGSFVIGICLALFKQSKLDTNTYLFLATGLCGGFTTFSAFSVENMSLLQNDKVVLFFLYAIGSVILALIATFLGYKLVS